MKIRNTNITKTRALELLGGVVETAKALGITKGAVSQWAEEDPIPDGHAYKIIYELCPEAFPRDVFEKSNVENQAA